MNLQPMSPTQFNAAGQAFWVACLPCGKSTPSTSVMCDLDGPAGSYYCPECAEPLRKPVTLGNRLMPGCECGAAEAGNFDRCRCD